MIPGETGKEGSETSHGPHRSSLVLPSSTSGCSGTSRADLLLSARPFLHALVSVLWVPACPCPRSLRVSPTTVPLLVYRAATSKVRFKVRNFWKSSPSSATTASSSRPRNQDNGEIPGRHREVGAESQPGEYTLPQHRPQPDESQPWAQWTCDMSCKVFIK